MIEVTVTLKEPHPKQRGFIYSAAKRKIIRAGRRGGKTTGIAIFACEQFLNGRRVLYATPTGDQIGKFWSEVCNALAEPIAAGAFRKNETNHLIEARGKDQRIRAKTAWNADTLRGDYADVLIMDEWQLMNEDAWEVVGAPMLIDNNGDAVFIYTPPSLHSKSVTKATDPRHASKMYAKAVEEMRIAAELGRESRWEAFHFTSLDNPHLSQQGLEEVTQDMTALAYRQEILADESDETAGALWKRETLEKCRQRLIPRDMGRIVIGVDPPGGATECGIVAVATAPCACKGVREIHGFVLEDASLQAGPERWSQVVAQVYKDVDADVVVAERNYGGDMVQFTIHTADSKMLYRDVQATRGKAVRAEPIAALYEQGRIHHIGRFDALEDELCNWLPGVGMPSPNRLDALVWAFTDVYKQITYGRVPAERDTRTVGLPTASQIQVRTHDKWAKNFDKQNKPSETYF